MIYAGKPAKRKFVYFIRNGVFDDRSANEIDARDWNNKLPRVACDCQSNGETTEYLMFHRFYVSYAIDGIFFSRFSSRSCKSDSTVKSMSQFPASSSNRPGPKWPRAVGAQSTMPNDARRSPVEDPTEVCTFFSVTTRPFCRSFLDRLLRRHSRLDISRRSNDTVVMWSSSWCTSNAYSDRQCFLFKPINQRLSTTYISDTGNSIDGAMQILQVFVSLLMKNKKINK